MTIVRLSFRVCAVNSLVVSATTTPTHHSSNSSSPGGLGVCAPSSGSLLPALRSYSSWAPVWDQRYNGSRRSQFTQNVRQVVLLRSSSRYTLITYYTGQYNVRRRRHPIRCLEAVDKTQLIGLSREALRSQALLFIRRSIYIVLGRWRAQNSYSKFIGLSFL